MHPLGLCETLRSLVFARMTMGALAIAGAVVAEGAVECPLASSQTLAKARAIVEKACSACHGVEGRGMEVRGQSGRITPHLAGQPHEFQIRALEGYRKGSKWMEDPSSVLFTDGMRVHEEMGYAVAPLTTEEMKAVSLWYECQGR
jgi:cytochrome c553